MGHRGRFARGYAAELCYAGAAADLGASLELRLMHLTRLSPN